MASTSTVQTGLRINEIFHSIQGEGAFFGTPSTFLRFQGCTVGCPWCDTKHTWDFAGGSAITPAELVRQVKKPHVVLTGGEPGQQPRHEMLELVRLLKSEGYRIQLETSGRFYAPWMDEIDWRTVSPKPPSYAVRPELLRQADEVKVVVDEEFNPAVIPSDIPVGCTVYLQPEGNKPHFTNKTLAMLQDHPTWRLSIQMHKILGLA